MSGTESLMGLLGEFGIFYRELLEMRANYNPPSRSCGARDAFGGIVAEVAKRRPCRYRAGAKLDEADRNIAAFLSGIQAARKNLHAVINHYIHRGLKVHSGPNMLGPIWTDEYLEFGLMVTGSDGRNYELSARLCWPGQEWVVEADISVEEETADGDYEYPLIRELPKRTAASWTHAISEFAKAMSDLTSFDEVIPSAK